MINREDILKPLIFLDIFDYPLTAFEVWQFLGVKAELGEIIKELNCQHFFHPERSVSGVKDLKSNEISKSSEIADSSRGAQDDNKKNSFYFLTGREKLIVKRQEFFQFSEKKFKIAKRAARLLRFIPSVKMIAVCNNFYYRPESDIDFFIITSANRLWLTRFWATLILDFFNLRAHGKKTANRICLSFYLSENNLNLENITLKPDDPYFCYWLAFIEPLYGQEVYNKFWEANGWLKNIFPNILPKQPVPRRQLGGVRPSRKGGAFGDWLEKIVKKIQWKIISRHVKEMAAAGDTRVVLNEAMLKFHENDRREEFRRKFQSLTGNYQAPIKNE